MFMSKLMVLCSTTNPVNRQSPCEPLRPVSARDAMSNDINPKSAWLCYCSVRGAVRSLYEHVQKPTHPQIWHEQACHGCATACKPQWEHIPTGSKQKWHCTIISECIGMLRTIKSSAMMLCSGTSPSEAGPRSFFVYTHSERYMSRQP